MTSGLDSRHRCRGLWYFPRFGAETRVRDRLDGSTPQLWRNLLNGAKHLLRPTFPEATGERESFRPGPTEIHAGTDLWITQARRGSRLDAAFRQRGRGLERH